MNLIDEGVLRFSAEDNGLVEILHFSELIIPIGETNCEVAQRQRPMKVSLRAKDEGFSAEDNGLVEVLHGPKQIVPIGEMNCECLSVGQDLSGGMALPRGRQQAWCPSSGCGSDLLLYPN